MKCESTNRSNCICYEEMIEKFADDRINIISLKNICSDEVEEYADKMWRNTLNIFSNM